MSTTEFKYKAFISYSHKDKDLTRWIHKKLDGYIPPSLRSNLAPHEHKSKGEGRWRVFRDDEELGVGNLSEKIKTALAESENLIVICSPDASSSLYVNEEIQHFKQIHGGQRVFAIIARGIPYHADEECFPKALKFEFHKNGEMIGRSEPIAADLQVFSRQQVLLKVIASLIGVEYGDLVDREHARRVRRILWASGVSTAVVILLVVAAALSILQMREAARSRADSYIQRGQRAVSEADLFEAQNWFKRALENTDSTLARSGLVQTIDTPLAFEWQWRVPNDAGNASPGLMSVTFVDDGHVVAGDIAGSVYLVNIDSHTLNWTQRTGGKVNALSFTPAKNQVVVGLDEGKLIWLDLEDGHIVAQKDMASSVLSLRHERSGQRLAVGMTGGIVVLDDTAKPLFHLQHNRAGSVQGTAFNAPGDYIYCGGSGAYIWACKITGECERMMRVEDWVYSIDGSPDRRFTAFAAGGTIEFFDHAMRQQQRLDEVRGHVFALRFDPSSLYLAAAGSSGSLSLYDVRAQKKLISTAAHKDEIYSVSFSPSGNRLVAVGLDRVMTVWKVFVKGGALPPYNFEPDPQMLAATQRNRISEIRMVRKNIALIRTWDRKDQSIRIDPNGGDGDELNASEFRQNLTVSLDLARTSAFRITEFSPEKLWLSGKDKPPPELAHFMDGDEPDNMITVLSRDRALLAVINSHGQARIFDGTNEASYAVEIGKGTAQASTFVRSERLLIVGFDGGAISGFHYPTGQKVLGAQCGSDAVFALLENYSGKRIITVTRSGLICLFDVTGQLISKANGIVSDAIALSPDETMLAAAGLTGEILLTSAKDLSEIARFNGHRGSVHALHFTLDGNGLVSGGADETIRVWPAGTAQRIMSTPIDELRLSYPALKAN